MGLCIIFVTIHDLIYTQVNERALQDLKGEKREQWHSFESQILRQKAQFPPLSALNDFMITCVPC